MLNECSGECSSQCSPELQNCAFLKTLLLLPARRTPACFALIASSSLTGRIRGRGHCSRQLLAVLIDCLWSFRSACSATGLGSAILPVTRESAARPFLRRLRSKFSKSACISAAPPPTSHADLQLPCQRAALRSVSSTVADGATAPLSPLLRHSWYKFVAPPSRWR